MEMDDEMSVKVSPMVHGDLVRIMELRGIWGNGDRGY